MVVEPLDRSVLSYIHGQYIILDENIDAAKAVREMHSRRAETIIVSKNGKPIGIVTDSDILDKIVMRGEDSDQVYLKDIMSSPIITVSAKATVRQALEVMRLNVIKRIPVTDNVNILGIVTQEGLADSIRTSVLERTFSDYRTVLREHYKPIFGNLGFVLQFCGILLIAPAILAVVLGEAISATGIFLGVTFMSTVGFALNAYGEKTALNLPQASILMVSSFLLLSLFGSIPYIYVNPFSNNTDTLSLFVNSFFESASGFTTTGLSLISQPEEIPQSFGFYRSFTQWVGGLSFIYLIITFFYPERKLVYMRGMIRGGMLKLKQLIITISLIFSIYTAILSAFLYVFGGNNIIYTISLIFSSVTGGGFVPASPIILSDNILQIFILITGMMIAGLPFAFHYAIFNKEFRTNKMRPEVVVYVGIILISIPIFYFLLNSSGMQTDWIASVFHIVSISTNTGFHYIDMSLLSVESKVMVVILMLVGGTAFSTAGGIKVGRILQIIQKVTKKRFAADISTRSISSTSSRYNKSFIQYKQQSEKIRAEKTFREALWVIALFVVLSFITGIILSYFEQKDFLNSLFESASALTTTGLTTGLTSINMDMISKIFLIINMIVGRFEIIAIAYLFLEIRKRK